jgi:microcystin-dependent protein
MRRYYLTSVKEIMSEPFIASIVMFGGNFAPRGWALCNGQLVSIAQNSALFSLLGTTFGGDGVQNFALPDLRGRVPIHAGNGPGLTPYVPGEQGGTENVTLIQNQMPIHNHVVNADGLNANSPTPAGTVLSKSASQIYNTAAPNTTMNPAMISNAGGNQPHPNLQPFLSVNFIIALQGIFPSRN